MPSFEVEKLVRNGIVDDILKSPQNSVEFEQLTGDEKLGALLTKCNEEVQELISSPRENLSKELIDIQSIINAICEELGIEKREFDKMVEEKENRIGNFDKGIYLQRVNFGEDYEWVGYFRKNYKEIK